MQNNKANSGFRLDEMVAGDILPSIHYQITPEMIAAYLEAVESNCAYPDSAPPLAIVAYLLHELTDSLSLPPGATHLAQDLECISPIPLNSTITCHSHIAQRSRHAGLDLIKIDLKAVDGENRTLLTASTTIALPGKRQA